KVVINVGYGRHAKENPYIEAVERTLQSITGQKPVHALSKKSISNFKIREGMDIGAFVTLRGKRMQTFLYKLVHLALPRVRDFRGLSPKSFDANGNYTIGFKENIAFPEVTGEKVDIIHGLEIVIVTTAKNKEEGLALLKAHGFPFRDK
ncbi:MAG: 50S ribosomal protein L5, partial [Patescibacteria group bacterium]